MEIHESSEDYLEAILMIQEKQGYVRSVDISDQLNVSKPSVTYATKKLKNANKQARIDACKVEHDISEKTFNAIKKKLNNKR